MNYKIKEKYCAAFACAVLSLIGILPIAAQTPAPQPTETPTKTEQLYVVSAQAGGVSAITGTARVTRANNQTLLAMGDELAAREKVTVETDGKLEVLLNPGSYLRVGGDSDFEFSSTALSDLKIDLSRGSALIEATMIGGEQGANLSFNTPQTVIQLEKSGLYRINVSPDATELYVWEGEARVGGELVKKGRKLIVSKTNATAIAKFDRDKITLDGLDLWSKTRADELARLNGELENTVLTTTFATVTHDENFSTGYWCYNRVTRRWCYVPFAWSRCCRAYNNRHTSQVALVQSVGGGSAPTIVVTNTAKNQEDSKARDSSKVDSSTKTTKSSKSSSSSNTDSLPTNTDYSPSKSDSSPSKSDEPSPSKSEPPPPPPPSKSDDSPSKSNSSPPSKKDGFEL